MNAAGALIVLNSWGLNSSVSQSCNSSSLRSAKAAGGPGADVLSVVAVVLLLVLLPRELMDCAKIFWSQASAWKRFSHPSSSCTVRSEDRE